MQPIDPKSLNHILIRVPNWIGDCIMCIPAIKALKQLAPQATIDVVGRPWVTDVFKRLPEVNDIIPFDKKGPDKYIKGFWRFCQSLKYKRADAFFLFQNAFEAGLMAKLSGVPLRAGYRRDGRGLLLTHPTPVNWQQIKSEHEVHYYLRILEDSFGLTSPLTPDMTLPGKGDPACYDAAFKKFNIAPRPVIGFAPGAAFGPAKRWPTQYFTTLAEKLQKTYNASIVILGSNSDIPTTQGIPGLNLCGKTSLSEMIDIIAGCDYFVTNDSGPMHVAAAFGIPQAAIFGSTDHIRTGPYGENATVVRDPGIKCSPCRKRTCEFNTYECLTVLKPERIFDLIKTALDAKK